MRRRPDRWLDVGSFALGVLTEALAQLRRTPAPGLAAPPAPAPPVRIDPARRRRRPAIRRQTDRPGAPVRKHRDKEEPCQP